MKAQSSLFLSQSYQDAWDDYVRSLIHPSFACWDYVILTASNEHQAEGFRVQLEERRRNGLLPDQTCFAVLPDEGGKRVGSGGATLGVLRYIVEQTGKTDFLGLRILVIHSGGDSKRVPQYSALGKLFSPVPHELPDGRASTLFDEFMIAMAGIPSRIREGMLLLSGDVILLFNPLQVDYSGEDAAVLSFKEDVETGKEHGVFLRGEDGNVAHFLHKQDVETLRRRGAINGRGCVDIDTGAVIFSAKMLEALYGLISANGVVDMKAYMGFVNAEVRLSLYGDFLYPLASESTLEQFLQEKPEGEYCEALLEARKRVWKALRPFRMKLLRLAPAKFIHFGTTHELLHLMSEEIDEYAALDWKRHVNSSITGKKVAGYCSVLSEYASCGQGSYLEVSYVHNKAKIGENVLLSHVDVHDETIPSGVVLHGLKQCDGRFVARIYGVDDNPKLALGSATFFGESMEDFLKQNRLDPGELWQDEEQTLWRAKLYPVCGTIREAISAALNLYAMAHGGGDVEAWREMERKSLCEGFNDAEPQALLAWNKRMRELVQMNRLAGMIRNGESVDMVASVLRLNELTVIQRDWLTRRLSRVEFGEQMRLHYYLGCILHGLVGEREIEKSFHCLREAILEETLDKLKAKRELRIVKEKHVERLPLRVNWGGGWSDTPPYCNEHGGTVLNAAILLNGKRPVEVNLMRIQEKRIILESRDMGAYGEFTQIEALQRTGDPYDPFALQKAALLVCGVLPTKGGKLEALLDKLGGGFWMKTEVVGVPKGSGLGTSSILAAACVKALFEFMGVDYEREDLYNHVLAMEQIMSTGGGWQDQVGGLNEGINYVTSMPGVTQRISVQHVRLSENTYAELQGRFALIYTGQRRLARNLLRDVVGRYIGNHPDSLYAINEIQRVAALMRFELERGNIDAFAELLNRHWELSKQIDAGSTNTVIEQIFASIEDLIDGRMICGAGGGGFLQVIMKRGVSKDNLRERLGNIFQDSSIDVWECKLMR